MFSIQLGIKFSCLQTFAFPAKMFYRRNCLPPINNLLKFISQYICWESWIIYFDEKYLQNCFNWLMSINGFVLISVCLNMVLLLVMFYCPHCKTFLLFFLCDPCVGGKVKRKQNVATFCDLMSNIKCFMDLSANINILLVHVCNSVELVQCHSNTFLIFSMVWMIWK